MRRELRNFLQRLSLLCYVSCLQNKVQKSTNNYKMCLLLLELRKLGIVLLYSKVATLDRLTACIVQMYRGMKSSEGRGKWNLRCDSGHLIFGGRLKQLLSSESFFSHCQELLRIGASLKHTRSMGWRVSKLALSVFSEQSYCSPVPFLGISSCWDLS